MPKNVLIFSDGTGQGARMPKAQLTNVCKLWQATRKVDPTGQRAFYDPGLGAFDKRDRSPWRFVHDLVSQATGLGISRNIKDCYLALMELYEPGDRIFLFGFSRGAYTVRSLGGVLTLCGIPQRDDTGKEIKTNSEREALAQEAVEKVYKHYGNDEKTKAERVQLGKDFAAKYASDPGIPFFIGVWDTVRSLGIPGSSGLVWWRHAFHNTSLNSAVRYARQALSIDENREAFEPVLWDETDHDRASGRIRQVWFPGVHSDIGGGYAERQLSDLALSWLIQEAIAVGLLVNLDQLALAPAFDGIQHDERTGLGWFWAEGTRERFNPVALREEEVGNRFRAKDVPTLDRRAPYRPEALRENPIYSSLY
jgi:uncharacterized protein (DUF2235 family)